MKLKSSGFSIIEVLVSVGILGIITTVFVGGLSQFRDISRQTDLLSSSDKQINDIAENIRANFHYYQVNFDYTATTMNSLLAVNSLPMAWDVGISVPAAQCTSCKGRYGFIIQPVDAFRGLFTVRLRFTHQDWGNGNFKDYIVLVSSK